MWFKDQRRAVRRMAVLVGLSSFVFFGGFAAQAQGSYPDKPVKIIVANPPGGPIDVILRVLATRLSAVWGQPVIVENRPGGAGIVSTMAVVKAAPDAYTIGMVAASSITIMPFAVDSLPRSKICNPSRLSRVRLLFLLCVKTVPLKRGKILLIKPRAAI